MSATWLPTEAARSLTWWDEAALRRLGTSLDAAVAAWQAAWGLQAPGRQCECRAITSMFVSGDAWKPLAAATGHAEAWLQVDEGAAQRVAAALFGTGPAGAMTQAVAKACHADGIERLAHSLSLEPTPGALGPIPAAAVSPWSGAVVADLAGAFVVRLVIGGEAARRWQQQRLVPRKEPVTTIAPLTTTADALARQPLTLGVHLDGCELTLGAVQDLQLGDVVRIGHGLEAPARITDATGARTFSGYLGRQGAHKAVELVRPAQHKVPS